MKLSAARDVLLRPLQAVIGVVERRQTMPILSNVLLVAKDNGLAVTATDLEVELVAEADVAVEAGGEITVSGRKLLDICRSLPEGAELNAKQEGNRVAVDSGRFSSHLATLPVAEFPAIDTPAAEVSIELRSGDLRRLLQRVSFAMAQQDVRYFFNGVLVDVEGKRVRMVATNGQRLAMSDLTLSNDLGKHQYIIPRKAVGELQRVLGTDGDEVISL